MDGVQILMPMGGLGSRFTKEGYTTPKPLIEVDGKPMFMRALDSFQGLSGKAEHIFVIRKDQDESYNLANNIRASLPAAKIAILDHDTQGAVETCLIAAEFIDDTRPIIIADCDIYFESSAYFRTIQQNDSLPDGMLLTFDSDDPRYSYVKLDEHGNATETAEKVVISNHAILGGYFFKSGALFKELAETFMANPLPDHLKEYYLSHLFNLLLEQDGQVSIADVDVHHIFGTPEELNAYFANKQ